MSKFQKGMHDICQPLIKEHSDELNTMNSELMKTAAKHVCSMYSRALADCIRTAYSDYAGDSNIEGIIEDYVDTRFLSNDIPDAHAAVLNNISGMLVTKSVDDIIYEDAETDYSESDSEKFDDYGYKESCVDIYDSNSYEDYESNTLNPFDEDVIDSVMAEITNATVDLYPRLILECATQAIEDHDYLRAMSYVNLVFTANSGELSSLMHETWGTARVWAERRKYWYYTVPACMHTIKMIYSLLDRMHKYENDEMLQQPWIDCALD